MIRRIAAVVAATAMLLILAVPVMAGGWAEIVADGQTTTPREGDPVEIGFRVLQHGETPAPWEGATVHFTNTGTGETFDVVAKNDRPDGHFVATTTITEAGFWSWQVTLANLESDHLPVRMTVQTAAGATPPIDPSSILAAVERAKSDVTNSLGERIGSEVQRLEVQDDYLPHADRQPRGPDQGPDRPARGAGGSRPGARGCRGAALAGRHQPVGPGWFSGRVRHGMARRSGVTAPGSRRVAQPCSARSRPGVTCSWRRRLKRPTRSGASAVSTHRATSSSPWS